MDSAPGERLIPEHAAELSRLKGASHTFSTAVSVLPADLPQVDFNALKKQMPAHSAILDSLQKQLESIKIPYGEIPKKFLQEIDHWTEYNNERIKFHDMKAADGLEEAKKVEAKWASAPPVEHFNRQHFVEYFPQEFYDLRYQNRIPDPCKLGINDFPEIETRFKDYKVLQRPDKVEDH